MKIILYSLINIVLFTNCFGNAKVDTHCENTGKTRGVFVVKYIKSEIELVFKNEVLKKENESYEHFIDFDKESFFLPLSNTNNNFVEIIKNRNPFDQRDIYFLPFSQRISVYLKKYCSEKNKSIVFMDLSKQESSKFYIMQGDEKWLYKIYYIVGDEIRLELVNNELNKIKLDLADEIDKNTKLFNVHFIYEIIHLKCNEKIPGFKIWLFPC